jgi:hypothetical protein
MLFGETVAVYCQNRTEHTDTVHTSQETHYVSATEPNRLMLFGGKNNCLLQEPYGTHRYSPYRTGNTLRLHYTAQPVNAVWGKQSLFIVRTIRNTQIHSEGKMQRQWNFLSLYTDLLLSRFYAYILG